MEYARFNNAGYGEVHKFLLGTWVLISHVRIVFAWKMKEIKPMQSGVLRKTASSTADF